MPRPDGRILRLRSWGWSNESLRDAQGKARDALGRLVTRVRQGLPLPRGYGYGQRPLREEIIREVAADAAVVTRNSYGCLVLNTSRVMFIDVDVSPPTLGQRLRRWMRGDTSTRDEPALARLREQLAASRTSYRVYRTAGGFRVLATEALFEPGEPATERLMAAVGADPAFVQLCRAQRSFRARLTPKPWRCGQRVPPGRFPRHDAGTRAAFDRWRATYDAATAGWATCARLEDIGSGWVHREVEPLLELHDQVTKATSGLPLA